MNGLSYVESWDENHRKIVNKNAALVAGGEGTSSTFVYEIEFAHSRNTRNIAESCRWQDETIIGYSLY